MRFALKEDGAIHIDSHYDNVWNGESTDGIFFRSYSTFDPKSKQNQTVFAMQTGMEGEENKVYLYRMVQCYTVATVEDTVSFEVADKKSETDFSETATIDTDAANGGTNVTDITDALSSEYLNSFVSNNIPENRIATETTITVDARVDVAASAYTEGETITFTLSPIFQFSDVPGNAPIPIADEYLNGTPMTVILYTGGICPAQIIHYKQDGTNEYFYPIDPKAAPNDGGKTFELLYDGEGNQYAKFEVTEFSDVQLLRTPIPEICIHEDADNDYICDKCMESLIAVSASSRMDIAGDVTVADITVSKEKVVSGEEVTVTTKALNGYTFAGWYIDETKVCDTLSYTFYPTATVNLVAEYQAKGNAAISVNNGSFTINGGMEKTTYDAVSHRIGTRITITATSEGFLNWKNENGKIVSTRPTYSFTVTGNTTLRMSSRGKVDGSDSSRNTALVEFISDFDQVISALTCDASESIVFPDGPSKVGHTFVGWSTNGVYTTDTETLAAIHTKIGLGETHIVIKPVYVRKPETFRMGVYVNGVENTALSKDSLHAGDIFTISAPNVDGMKFKCWALDASGENLLSTESDYFMQISKSTSLYAVYVASDVEVVKEPVVAITNIFATDNDGVHKVSFAATRNASQGYTLIEQGMLYGRSHDFAEAPTAEAFVIGGFSVYKFVSSDTSAYGVFTMNIRVTGIESETIYARAYMLVKDNLTGNTRVVYSSIESGIYNNLMN